MHTIGQLAEKAHLVSGAFITTERLWSPPNSATHQPQSALARVTNPATTDRRALFVCILVPADQSLRVLPARGGHEARCRQRFQRRPLSCHRHRDRPGPSTVRYGSFYADGRLAYRAHPSLVVCDKEDITPGVFETPRVTLLVHSTQQCVDADSSLTLAQP